MNLPTFVRSRFRLETAPAAFCRVCLAALLVFVAEVASAQDVLAPPPNLAPETQLPELLQPNAKIQANQPSMEAPSAPLQWGQLQFHPHLNYQFSYTTGLLVSSNHSANSIINELSPGMLFMLGSHWTLDYTPTLRYYSEKDFQDTLDHSVILSGSTVYRDWKFSLSQGYSDSSEPFIQTGTQISTESYLTDIRAAWDINSRLSLELNFAQAFQFLNQQVSTNAPSGPLNNSRDWSTTDWLNYQFSPEFGAALGVVLGYTAVDIGPNMTYEQVLGRLSWNSPAATNVSVTVHGGVEDRQFSTVTEIVPPANVSVTLPGSPNQVNPIMGADVVYRPFQYTSLSLGANSSVSASAFAGQLVHSIGVSAGLQQRLFGRLQLGLSGGYTTASYTSTTSSTPPAGSGFEAIAGRHDDTTYFAASLTVPVLKYGQLGAFYQYTQNTTTPAPQSGFSFSNSQVGLSLSFRY